MAARKLLLALSPAMYRLVGPPLPTSCVILSGILGLSREGLRSEPKVPTHVVLSGYETPAKAG